MKSVKFLFLLTIVSTLSYATLDAAQQPKKRKIKDDVVQESKELKLEIRNNKKRKRDDKQKLDDKQIIDPQAFLITDFPNEMLINILSFISIEELFLKLSLVSKNFKQLVPLAIFSEEALNPSLLTSRFGPKNFLGYGGKTLFEITAAQGDTKNFEQLFDLCEKFGIRSIKPDDKAVIPYFHVDNVRTIFDTILTLDNKNPKIVKILLDRSPIKESTPLCGNSILFLYWVNKSQKNNPEAIDTKISVLKGLFTKKHIIYNQNVLFCVPWIVAKNEDYDLLTFFLTHEKAQEFFSYDAIEYALTASQNAEINALLKSALDSRILSL